MKKGKKRIASILGAATIAAGTGIAAVAQACPSPTSSEPVTNYFNALLGTTDGVLNDSGLFQFWALYNAANNDALYPNNHVDEANKSLSLLSNVRITFDITNVKNTSGNIYNLTFSMTKVVANVLGSTNTTTFSPSQNRNNLYQLRIEDFDISLPPFPRILPVYVYSPSNSIPSVVIVDSIDNDFLVSTIVEKRVFEFYNTENANTLLDTIILSSEFSIEGSVVTPDAFRNAVIDFALGNSLTLFDITVVLSEDIRSSVLSVEINTGSVSYMYPVPGENDASFTIPNTGPLRFTFDISTNFVAPTNQNSVTGVFEFQVPPTTFGNV